MVRYFYIKDCKKIGKEEKGKFFLFDQVEGWTVDEKSIITDRLIGLDSFKRIGNIEIIKNIVEITTEEVIELLTKRPLDLN